MSLIPFDDRDGWIWLNGEFVPWRDAKIHVICHGLHYASVVFEGARCYNGTTFELTKHNQRLIDSGKMCDMEVPYSASELDQACIETLAKNDLTEAYVRAFAWRGSEEMGVSAQNTKVHTAVAVWEWPAYYDEEMLEKGIKLKMVDKWRRPAPDTAPVHAKAAGLYMICTMSKHAAEAEGYNDCLMLDYRGHVAEATSANIFFVKDGALHTPTPDCFLNGITRQTVIRLAEEKGIEVVERTILPEELGAFEECFVTGTAAEVTAVGQIDDHNYIVGPVTRDLRTTYENLVRGKEPAEAA